MKRIFIFSLLIFLFVSPAYAVTPGEWVFSASEGLTGTGGDTLDEISSINADLDGDGIGDDYVLTTGDKCITTDRATGEHFTHIYDSASSAAESSPDVIAPNDAGATGRWLLAKSIASSISVGTTDFDGNLSGADDTVQKALDTLDDMTAASGGSGVMTVEDYGGVVNSSNTTIGDAGEAAGQTELTIDNSAGFAPENGVVIENGGLCLKFDNADEWEDFARGEVVTGGGSGGEATIAFVHRKVDDVGMFYGVLHLTAWNDTSFSDNEALTTPGGSAGLARGTEYTCDHIAEISSVSGNNITIDYGLAVAVDTDDAVKHDNSRAFEAMADDIRGLPQGTEFDLLAGTYHVAGPVDLIDMPVSVNAEGQGNYKTRIDCDFKDAGAGCFDFSFSSNTKRDACLGGHEIHNITFFSSQNAIGAPMGVKTLLNQQMVIDNVLTWPSLWNYGVFATDPNNSDFNLLHLRSGYQPIPYGDDLASDVTFSSTEGSTTIVASKATFTANHEGLTLLMHGGGPGTENTILPWSSVIVTVTDSTHVEVADEAPATDSGFTASFGYTTCTVTGDGIDKTINFNHDFLTSDHEDMYVAIPLARTVTDAGSKKGLFVTQIDTVTSGTEAELKEAPTAAVTDGIVFFPGSMFVGSVAGASTSRQLNDLTINQSQFESSQSVALLVNKAIALQINDCKFHMEAEYDSSNTLWGRSLNPMVLSEVKNVEIHNSPFTYGSNNDKGMIRVMGSRGMLTVSGGDFTGMFPGVDLVYAEEVTDAFRLVVGPLWITDYIDKHDLDNDGDVFNDWIGFTVPNQYTQLLYGGPINYRTGGNYVGQLNPAIETRRLSVKTVGSRSDAYIDVTVYGSGKVPRIRTRRATGSEAATDAGTSGQTLAPWIMQGHDGVTDGDSGFADGIIWQGYYGEDWSSGNHAASMCFKTNKEGGQTTPDESLCIDKYGNINIPSNNDPFITLTPAGDATIEGDIDLQGDIAIKTAAMLNFDTGSDYTGADLQTLLGKDLPVYVEAPATEGSSCSEGEMSYDEDYFYLCFLDDNWARWSLTW